MTFDMHFYYAIYIEIRIFFRSSYNIMSKVHESEETIQKRVCKKKLHEEKEENQSSTDDCHSADCPHNLKSKIFNYIGSFGKAPSFMQDNRFILHGYRITYDSPKKIFKRYLF